MQEENDLKLIWGRLFEVIESIRDLHSRKTRMKPSPQTTLAQMKVMHCILFNPEGETKVKDIARQLAITPGAVSQAVDKMVKDGMVDRIVSDTDRRSVSISLSKKGLEIHRYLEASFSELIGQLLRKVPVEKQTVFLEVLNALLDAVKEEKEKLE